METEIKEIECNACDSKIEKFDENGTYECQCGEMGNIDGRSAVKSTFCLECEGMGKTSGGEVDNPEIKKCIECDGTGNPLHNENVESKLVPCGKNEEGDMEFIGTKKEWEDDEDEKNNSRVGEM